MRTKKTIDIIAMGPMYTNAIQFKTEDKVKFQAFRDVLADLPPDEREAAILVLGSGFSCEEAAEICDTTVATIRDRLNRSRMLLVVEGVRDMNTMQLVLNGGREAEAADPEIPLPPKWAGSLLTVFAKSPGAAEAAVGCLHERFVRDCAKYGARHARLYCWAETVRSLWPLFCRAVGRAMKWAAIISAVRRYFVG